MSLFEQLDKIHDKMHSLIGRTGENAARVVIPIVLTILHRYRKHVSTSGSDLDALKKAIVELREGGKGAIEATLTEFRTEHSGMSETLDNTLKSTFDDVLGQGLPPARLNALLDYISSQDSFLSEFTHEDFLGAMFEVLVSDAFRGDNGQFFTPKNIILIIREIMLLLIGHSDKTREPRTYTVCDPCCGSARFLIYWSERILADIELGIGGGAGPERRVRAQEGLKLWAEKQLFGIDIEPKIASYACLNMLLHGDGSTNIATADSLNYYGVFAHWPKIVAFCIEFVSKWEDLKVKYAASRDFAKTFEYIEERKSIVSEVATGGTKELDLADSRWRDLLEIIGGLLRIENNTGTGWDTIRELEKISDFKSVLELMKYQWGERNTNIRGGFDILLTNPPFGRGGKNLQVSAENENERFILAQYRLATELWLWDANPSVPIIGETTPSLN